MASRRCPDAAAGVDRVPGSSRLDGHARHETAAPAGRLRRPFRACAAAVFSMGSWRPGLIRGPRLSPDGPSCRACVPGSTPDGGDAALNAAMAEALHAAAMTTGQLAAVIDSHAGGLGSLARVGSVLAGSVTGSSHLCPTEPWWRRLSSRSRRSFRWSERHAASWQKSWDATGTGRTGRASAGCPLRRAGIRSGHAPLATPRRLPDHPSGDLRGYIGISIPRPAPRPAP